VATALLAVHNNDYNSVVRIFLCILPECSKVI